MKYNFVCGRAPVRRSVGYIFASKVPRSSAHLISSKQIAFKLFQKIYCIKLVDRLLEQVSCFSIVLNADYPISYSYCVD